MARAEVSIKMHWDEAGARRLVTEGYCGVSDENGSEAMGEAVAVAIQHWCRPLLSLAYAIQSTESSGCQDVQPELDLIDAAADVIRLFERMDAREQ